MKAERSLYQKIIRTLDAKILGFKYHSTFWGWIFLKFVKVFKVSGCKFPLSTNLFSTGYYSRFIFKTYEKPEIANVKRYVKEGDNVLELGACLGIVSCITNKQLRNNKNHVVVEANPTLISEIEKNRSVNNCGFSIENKLISEKKENTFNVYNLALSGSLVEKDHNPRLKLVKKANIEGVSVSHLESKYNIKFNVLIMDIEGGEYEFLRNNIDFIKGLRLLIIEFHPHLNEENDKTNYQKIFEDHGFKMVDFSEQTFVYLKN